MIGRRFWLTSMLNGRGFMHSMSWHNTARAKFPKCKFITKHVSRSKSSPSNLQLIWRLDHNSISRNNWILLSWIIARNIFTGYKEILNDIEGITFGLYFCVVCSYSRKVPVMNQWHQVFFLFFNPKMYINRGEDLESLTVSEGSNDIIYIAITLFNSIFIDDIHVHV